MNITIYHSYIIRENGLDFWCITVEYLLRWGFKPANFESRRTALTFAPAATYRDPKCRC